MKNYRITVNGVAYDVAVEEISADQMGTAPVVMPQMAAPTAPKAPAKKAAPKAAAGAAGDVKVNAPMPGKIVGVNVKPGQAVSKGDVAVVLEAMKMENEICVPQDGTIASVEVSVGDGVEGGAVLVTMN